MAGPTSPSRSSAESDDGRCVVPSDLTAFALDEMPAARRAAVSRHVLRCVACRTRLDRESAMFARLRGFSADAAWEDEVAAAVLAFSARGRTLRRAALAGVCAAAVLVAAWV